MSYYVFLTIVVFSANVSLSDKSVTFLGGATLLDKFTIHYTETIPVDGEIIKLESGLRSIVQKCENYLIVIQMVQTSNTWNLSKIF